MRKSRRHAIATIAALTRWMNTPTDQRAQETAKARSVFMAKFGSPRARHDHFRLMAARRWAK
jgi:hypothetical protein